MQRRHFIKFSAAQRRLGRSLRPRSTPARCVGLVCWSLGEGGPGMQARLMAFRRGSEQLGWSEGRNIRFDIRFAPAGAGQEHSRAQELVALKPDVIFASHSAGGRLIAAREPCNPYRVCRGRRSGRCRVRRELEPAGRQPDGVPWDRSKHRWEMADDAQGDCPHYARRPHCQSEKYL